tara:strand:- start:57 stop:539 length:483 start_codon:yes stop_codon:yes gene_type:complete
MQLSKHFKLSEFTKSQVAVRKGIKNTASSGEIKNLTDLCYGVLEKARVKFDRPVTINSGFRCLELNRAIGSGDSSQHCKGMAADIEIPGIPNIQLAYWIQANCDFDQLILEFYQPEEDSAGWVHVSFCEGSNRNQVLTFNGKKYDNGLPEMQWKGGKVVE